jgi:hypothetical protein
LFYFVKLRESPRAVNELLQENPTQTPHCGPHHRIHRGSARLGRLAEGQKTSLEVGVAPRGVGAFRKNTDCRACADDMNVEDRDMITSAPIAHDPGRGLRANTRQGTKGIAQGDIGELIALNLGYPVEGTGKIMGPLRGKAVSDESAADAQRLAQQQL